MKANLDFVNKGVEPQAEHLALGDSEAMVSGRMKADQYRQY